MDSIDPTDTSAGVFAGQLVAATISLAMDNAGIPTSSGGTSSGGALEDLVLGSCATPALIGKTVSVLVRRRLVGVLGSIDDFRERIWLMAVQEGVLTADLVIWLSDGGRGFWRVFRERFAWYGCGILDFYHAAQHLWAGAKTWLDGRTTAAKTWFTLLR